MKILNIKFSKFNFLKCAGINYRNTNIFFSFSSDNNNNNFHLPFLDDLKSTENNINLKENFIIKPTMYIYSNEITIYNVNKVENLDVILEKIENINKKKAIFLTLELNNYSQKKNYKWVFVMKEILKELDVKVWFFNSMEKFKIEEKGRVYITFFFKDGHNFLTTQSEKTLIQNEPTWNKNIDILDKRKEFYEIPSQNLNFIKYIIEPTKASPVLLQNILEHETKIVIDNLISEYKVVTKMIDKKEFKKNKC